MPSALTDMNPSRGKYTVMLSWGRLAYNPAGDSMDKISEQVGESNTPIMGYKVYMTDEYGRVQEDLLTVAPLYKNKGTKTDGCCNHHEYAVALTGDWPENMDTIYFMVVPYQNFGASSLTVYTLPLGPVSGGVTDYVSMEAATKVTAEFVFMVEGGADGDVADFLNSPQAKIMAQRALAYAMPADITQAMITIISMMQDTTSTGSRRLGGGRRLATGIKIVFEIFVPPGSDAEFDASTLNKEVFKESLKEEVADADLGYTITVTSVEDVLVTTELLVDETATSAALPVAAISSSFLVFFIMFAGNQVLA
jgi:hypothetical protein